MDNQYYKNEATQIINDLCDEFSKEEMKLKVKVDNNCAKLDEMDHQIRTMSKTEDIEMKVFSPRRHISAENEKITSLKKEREDLDKVNREVEREYRYYTKRAEKLRYLSDLLERSEGLLGNGVPEYVSEQIRSTSIDDVVAQNKAITKDDLLKLQNRLDNCYHFIDSDSERAKVEVKSLMLMIADLIGQID